MSAFGEVLSGALSGGLVTWVLLHFRERKPAPPKSQEETCAGYYRNPDGSGNHGMKHDCKGVRSAVCSDGRCSFHCRDMCKCEASNAPEFIGRPR